MKSNKLMWAVSTRADGNMSISWGQKAEVEENGKRFLNKYNIDYSRCVMASLLGGTDIQIVSNKESNQYVECDSLITTEINLPLMMVVADCHPAIVYDPNKNILSLVHLGRQGVDGLLPEIVVGKFKDMGSEVNNIQVIVGPGIKKESYEWTGDLPFQKEKWQGFFTELGGNKYLIDSLGFLKEQFLRKGVLSKNMIVDETDVVKNPNYFSHVRSFRTGESEGRFAMIAMMRA